MVRFCLALCGSCGRFWHVENAGIFAAGDAGWVVRGGAGFDVGDGETGEAVFCVEGGGDAGGG